MRLVALAAAIAGLLFLILNMVSLKDLFYHVPGEYAASQVFFGVWAILVAVLLYALIARS